MLYGFIYFMMTCVYLWVFRVCVLPPHTWITHTAVAFVWLSSIFVCFTSVFLLYQCRKQVKRALLCDIQGSLPEIRVISMVLSMLAMVVILAEAGHIKTSMISCLAWVCTCVFMWKMLVYPPQVVRCNDDSERLKYQAIDAWEKHDFHRVAVILSQCDMREIEDISEEVERLFGTPDARLIKHMLD